MSLLAICGWAIAFTLAGAWLFSMKRLRAVLSRGSHELRRPLQQAFLLAPEGYGPMVGAMERSLSALDEFDALIERRRVTPRRELVDVKGLLEDCLEVSGRSGGCPVDLDLRWMSRHARVVGDPDLLRRIFDNLIENAATHGSPPIRVSASDHARSLALLFTNRVCEAERPGSGHGLRIVRDLVSEHGGRFRSRRRPDRFEAMVELPLPRG